MAVIYPKTRAMYKINQFSTLDAEDGTIYLSTYLDDKEKNISMENKVLFDGNNLYLFLAKTKIQIGEQEYEVSPLSYAIVTYNQGIELYDYEKDMYYILETGKQNIIAENEEYKINMSTDILISGKTEQLLVRNINYLDSIK